MPSVGSGKQEERDSLSGEPEAHALARAILWLSSPTAVAAPLSGREEQSVEFAAAQGPVRYPHLAKYCHRRQYMPIGRNVSMSSMSG